MQPQTLDTRYSEIAELMYVTNKYYPGVQEFKINALVTDKYSTTTQNTKINITNKDNSMLGIDQTIRTNTLKIKLPKEHTINYPDKFIPPGTNFIVNFIGGDISRPLIIGRIDK